MGTRGTRPRLRGSGRADFYHGLFLLRFEGRGEEAVAQQRFVGRDATESLFQGAGALGGKRGPHLQKTIWKSCLENAARDRRELHLMTQLGAAPELFLAAFESPKRLRLARAEFQAAVSSEHFNEPGVGFAGRKPLHLETHRHFFS